VTVIHLGPPVARRLVRPTRELRRRAGAPANRDALSYLALLRVELASFHPVAGLPATDSSLWRWSSPRGGRALPATLRRGARTFLTPAGRPAARDHPAASLTGAFYPGPAAGPSSRQADTPARRPGEDSGRHAGAQRARPGRCPGSGPPTAASPPCPAPPADRPSAATCPGRYPGSSPPTTSAMARPRVAWAAASRWTPSTGSASTSPAASTNAAPHWRAASR
jgi:hypothetical protein